MIKPIKEQYRKMTLLEKFEEFTEQKSYERANYDAQECEQIADDYAIEFAEWCMETENKLGYHEGKREWYVWNLDKWLSTKELLEIFKKEKGL